MFPAAKSSSNLEPAWSPSAMGMDGGVFGRSWLDAYCNRTFAIFALVAGLTVFGLTMVYSASAAIAASRENRAMARRAEQTRDLLRAEGVTLTAAAENDPLDVDTPSYHSAGFLRRQAIGAILGAICLFIFYSIDYQFWRKWAPWILLGAIALLFAVWAPVVGRKVNGAARWVNLGIMTVQSSEVAKLAIVLFFARQLSRRQRDMKSFRRGFIPNVAVLGAVAALILKEPDLGATACLGLIAFAMFWVGGMRKGHLALLALAAIAAVCVELMVPYRRARLLAFLEPEAFARTHAWQLQQSLIAMGSGGPWGLGLGAGPQKYMFLSEAYTDFVYAIIGEEFGMAGALIVAICYASLCALGWVTAMRAPDLHGSLLATGITCLFAISAFIHMMVNTGLSPTKGLTLPFISYGSSSLMVNLAAAGLLMNVSRQAELHRWSPGAEEAASASSLWPDEPVESPTAGRGRVIVRRRGETREVPLPPMA